MASEDLKAALVLAIANIAQDVAMAGPLERYAREHPEDTTFRERQAAALRRRYDTLQIARDRLRAALDAAEGASRDDRAERLIARADQSLRPVAGEELIGEILQSRRCASSTSYSVGFSCFLRFPGSLMAL